MSGDSSTSGRWLGRRVKGPCGDGAGARESLCTPDSGEGGVLGRILDLDTVVQTSRYGGTEYRVSPGLCREKGGARKKRLPWSEWRQSGRMHVNAGSTTHALAKSGWADVKAGRGHEPPS